MMKISCAAIKGLVLAMMSAAFDSGDAVSMKMITSLPAAQLSLYRFIALFMMSLPEMVKCKENPFGPKEDRIYVITRGIFGGLSLFFTYTAYRLLPLGEAAVILYSNPIFVTVGARIFLKETCSTFELVLVIVTVIGVAITSKVPSYLIEGSFAYTSENIYGLLAAITSCLCRTIQVICLRKSKNVHHAVFTFNLGWIAIVESIILMAIFSDYKLQECGVEWIFILLIGFFSFSTQSLITLALKFDCAGPISNTQSAAFIILSFIWETFLFHESADTYTIVGAFLVGSCIIGAVLSKFVSFCPAKKSI